MKIHIQHLSTKALAVAIFFSLATQVGAQSENKSFSTPVRHYDFVITSSDAYLLVQDTIEDLASRMYNIYQQHPGLSYRFAHDVKAKPIAVTITGINDKSLAEEVSFYLAKLEILGHAVSQMNYAHFPEAVASKDFKVLSRKEAMSYVPQISASTILYNPMLTRNDVNTNGR